MDNIQEFIDAVKKYINLIDKAQELELDKFLNECVIVLTQIYYLGKLLPNVDVTDDVLKSTGGSLSDRLNYYKEAVKRVEQLLGEYDSYNEVFDPIHDKDVLVVPLSNDLAEIYEDLKGQLIEYESGDETRRKSAIWEWKFTIKGHAGDHIVTAIRVIHNLLHW
jgi:hypothetical protein